MGGIFTQSRKLQVNETPSIWLHNNGVPASQSEKSGVIVTAPTQTTTSFRSSRAIVDQDPVLAELKEISSRNWLEYSPYDNGHPFDTTKQEWKLSHSLVDFKRSNSAARYRGPLIPSSAWFSGSVYRPVPSFDSTLYGTTAYKKTIPTKPVSDMAEALGELRQPGGVPDVVGNLLRFESRAALARSAGKEYLNLEFGWAPLEKDIMKISNAVISSNELVKQYLRDSGRNIRRKYTFPDIHEHLSTVSDVIMSTAFDGLGNQDTQLFTALGGNIGGRGERWINHDRKIWFSGSYTYYLSEGIDPLDNLSKYAALARKLVGARLSPEVLWQLQPWSWLVDWWFNVGDVLSNIESFQSDGLVLRYGYLMCTDVVTSDITVYRHGLMDLFGPVTLTSVTTRKQRIRATPYGFGINLGTLSPQQWAILAALGLTKTPTSLR